MLKITPTLSMLFSSSQTFALIGVGTFRGLNRACGWAPSCNLMEYSSPSFSRPWKRDGYCASQSFPLYSLNTFECCYCRKTQRLVQSRRMMHTGSVVCLFRLKSFPVNCPKTFVGRPLRLWKVHSDTAVTSAPVSTLKCLQFWCDKSRGKSFQSPGLLEMQCPGSAPLHWLL